MSRIFAAYDVFAPERDVPSIARAIAVEQRVEVPDALIDEPAASSSDPGPLEEALAREDAAAVRACLEELEPAERALCWKVCIEGCAKRELARRTGEAESTLRLRLQRALHALRTCLQGKGLVETETET